jgi:NOL1/NOP2/fmu family ribosome biogenesis protein
MLSQILDFGFSILVSLGSSFTNEAVFSQISPNGIKTATIEQQSLRQDITSNFLETSFDVLNNIELDDLENIMTTEFAQGLPSDIEFSGW